MRRELKYERFTVSSVKSVASWFALNTETSPKWELSKSGWAPVSAWIRARSEVRPWESEAQTKPTQKEYLDTHPDFG